MMSSFDQAKLIDESKELFRVLFPICRSITGEGVRKSLSILKKFVEFDLKEIPSGTPCYDWIIPDEWNINDAYVKDSQGNKIIDFNQNNLHVVSYSIPLNQTMSFNELDQHLHTLPNLSDAIPYRTSYYKKDWGFCMTHNQYKKMNRKEKYQVVIDSTLKPGRLNYGEFVLEGDSGFEFLFSTYCCHPSMANDNLSGLILWALLLRELKHQKTRHSYRFIVVPETIGSIAYLHNNEKEMKNVSGGFILTCTAGPNNFSYKKTFQNNHFIDQITLATLTDLRLEHTIYPFDIRGSDERQYSSPFFRIPMGTICRDKYHEFDFYHTSKDNLEFIKHHNLIEMLSLYSKIIENLEKTSLVDLNNAKTSETRSLTSSHIYRSLHPYCEPMLSKRGLYPSLGGSIRQNVIENKNVTDKSETELSDAINWVLFYADGVTSIEQISKICGISFDVLLKAANILIDTKLLERTDHKSIT